MIKLPAGSSEDEHLGLLGLLNSSVACFWLKQVCFPKGGDSVGGDGARVRPAILQAAKSSAPDVSVAALRALEQVGDASTVALLAETAAAGPKGPVQDAARRTPGGLRGRAVDEAIVAGLAKPGSDAVAAELLRAVAERRLFIAKPSVAASLSAPSRVGVPAIFRP